LINTTLNTDCTASEASTLATGNLLPSFQDRSYEFHEGLGEYPKRKNFWRIHLVSFFTSYLG
jgi:hypothetical protein